MEEVQDFIDLGVVLNKKGEVLIIRRVKQEEGIDGKRLVWAFPGGKQFIGETREQRVKEEVLAETGYAVNPLKQISVRIHPQFPVTVVYFYCELISEKPVQNPSEPEEVAEVKWVKPKELKNYFQTDLDPKVAKFLGIEL